jgi:periplasmic protein TonB
MITLKIPLVCILFIDGIASAKARTTMPLCKGIPMHDSSLYRKPDLEARFPGGHTAWAYYLQRNLRADVPVKHKAPAGTYQVMLQFIVAKDGSISGITATTKHGYGMEAEVVRIIQKSPRWLPARQNGRSVNAY